jgi:hypothetical protein
LRYDLACARSLASAAADGKPDQAEQRRLAELALQDLAAAFADGYRNTPWMHRDPCFDSLRERDDFKKLLRELEDANRASR